MTAGYPHQYYPHQYIERKSGRVVTERLFADRTVHFLYNNLRENVPKMFAALTSRRMTSLLGHLQYDMVGLTQRDGTKMFAALGADWRECVEPLSFFTTMRRVFERQIRYWEVRPMEETAVVVSPADSRILIGSYAGRSPIFIKSKFFDIGELLGEVEQRRHFLGGDYAIFRLTPDKYHYNHVPVSGRVVETYTIDGAYHSCNPTAQIAVASLCARNRRTVTIIDTDVDGGAQIGLVAMVEVVALMIGDIRQAYSEQAYDAPCAVRSGMFLKKGCPKSLFCPGSSTVVLLFEPDRIAFCDDIVANSCRVDVKSRFTEHLQRPLVETDVSVRSAVAVAKNAAIL